MSKKHTKYYLVVKDSGTSYQKIESDLTFSTEEGEKFIKENNPDAKTVKHIADKKAFLLGLVSVYTKPKTEDHATK